MRSEWSQIVKQHWVIGGVLVSLLWFFAGKQSLSNGRPDAAIFWQSIGAIILLILCGWAIAEKQWLGLAVGLAVLYVEGQSLKRVHSELGRRRNHR